MYADGAETMSLVPEVVRKKLAREVFDSVGPENRFLPEVK
jgi:hypothetical protein